MAFCVLHLLERSKEAILEATVQTFSDISERCRVIHWSPDKRTLPIEFHSTNETAKEDETKRSLSSLRFNFDLNYTRFHTGLPGPIHYQIHPPP